MFCSRVKTRACLRQDEFAVISNKAPGRRDIFHLSTFEKFEKIILLYAFHSKFYTFTKFEKKPFFFHSNPQSFSGKAFQENSTNLHAFYGEFAIFSQFLIKASAKEHWLLKDESQNLEVFETTHPPSSKKCRL